MDAVQTDMAGTTKMEEPAGDCTGPSDHVPSPCSSPETAANRRPSRPSSVLARLLVHLLVHTASAKPFFKRQVPVRCPRPGALIKCSTTLALRHTGDVGWMSFFAHTAGRGTTATSLSFEVLADRYDSIQAFLMREPDYRLAREGEVFSYLDDGSCGMVLPGMSVGVRRCEKRVDFDASDMSDDIFYLVVRSMTNRLVQVHLFLQLTDARREFVHYSTTEKTARQSEANERKEAKKGSAAPPSANQTVAAFSPLSHHALPTEPLPPFPQPPGKRAGSRPPHTANVTSPQLAPDGDGPAQHNAPEPPEPTPAPHHRPFWQKWHDLLMAFGVVVIALVTVNLVGCYLCWRCLRRHPPPPAVFRRTSPMGAGPPDITTYPPLIDPPPRMATMAPYPARHHPVQQQMRMGLSTHVGRAKSSVEIGSREDNYRPPSPISYHGHV
ncbi:unnamed protein product [Vitrella brassicaformis CCMP3155]|uniref:Uncharacterized protein n=2 Tax=Vitrella brassicaformis TaxID=1169539 RepID=A0A0G4EK47_VITBC|nr:unnamed protein product [Vitrella brassicaformis CCMP3155]|mmetsp:Transcript_869/g.2287  ORF Transcript_869/g.2287 Transcript_869/m.2287 type:complete len:439 (-) Transcript_869:338-1654(-)|eukprot:CEL96781.1 unnamed protein product [Vitrella brassicaformis CCMP3155]